MKIDRILFVIMISVIMCFAQVALAQAAADGTLKWSYPTGDGVYSSPAIGSDGTVYVGLYAINPNGTLKWWLYTTGAMASSPAIGSDGTVYVGSEDGNLYAINSNGTLKWSHPTVYPGFSSLSIGGDGTVYMGSRDRNLYAINPNGTLKWSYPTGAAVYSSPAIGSDGTVYVGSGDNLYAINPNGTFKWSSTEYSVYSSPAIGSDGTVYMGSRDSNLYAINSNGTLKWSYPTGATVGSSPAIGSDGTVYVGSNDGNLYAINPNGTLKWSYPIGDYVSSSPAIGDDGTVYVGSYDGNLYAINSNGGPLATSPWPKFHNNNMNTGRAGGVAITPNLELSPSSYNFSNLAVGICSAIPKEFTISNTGNGNLQVSNLTVSDTTNFTLMLNGGSNPCSVNNPTIALGTSCTVTVAFCPSAGGTISANLTVISNDPTAATLNVPLQGTGIATYTLNVNVSDGGTVTSSDGKISCTHSTSSASYTQGTSVTLKAKPNAGFNFTGWNGGGCSGTGDCNVSMNASITVNASFAKTVTQIRGWSSITGYNWTDTNIRRAAANMVGQPSGQSTTLGTWQTDVSGVDGSAMRSAASIYDKWKRNDPMYTGKTLKQIRSLMVGSFKGTAYGSTQINMLVDRIIAIYDGGNTSVPQDDETTLQYLGIQKQCLEWAMSIAKDAGGTPKNYQVAINGGGVAKQDIRPGMGYYVYNPKTNVGGHAMIIIDTYYDAKGQLTQLKVAESNWGSGWSNPAGQIPWMRIIGGSRFFNYGKGTFSTYTKFVVVKYDN